MNIIIALFDSNLVVALITLFVGSFAIGLYIKQKWDYKRDAASIILMEIRNAEKIMDDMKKKEISMSLNMENLLPNNSWVKYNHLFIKDLDRDELDLVNNFYNQCIIIDYALAQLNAFRQIEQKAGFIQQGLVQVAKDAISEADYESKKSSFLNFVGKEPYVFPSDAAIKTIDKGLLGLTKITTTASGSKLKKIAKI